MRLSVVEILRLVPVAAAVAAAFATPAHADDRADRYTGVAVTYYFGGGKPADTGADLSLGAMEHWIDYRQDSSYMHVPVVSVPLIRQGEPLLAPIEALAGAFRWLRRDHHAEAAACAGDECATLAISLPDLGAR
jgi:hypothetical protein